MLKKSVLPSFVVLLATVIFPTWPSSVSTIVRAQSQSAVDYDIVYVRVPRPGDNQNSFWPDAITPLVTDPGADLVLLHPNGSEEVLFAAGQNGAVVDPSVSYDVADGCTWQASSSVNWIMITSNASGSGSRVVGYAVSPNETGATRKGQITAGGAVLVVKQKAR